MAMTSSTARGEQPGRRSGSDRQLRSDLPITDEADDRLGRAPFVDRLVEILGARMPSHSLVVALTGAWGDGKSSLLELVAGRMSQSERTGFVWFEPWHYESLPELIDALLAAIEDDSVVKSRKVRSAARNARKQLRHRTTGSARGFAIHLFNLTRQTSVSLPPSLAASLALLSDALVKSEQRIILVCEDLDRLSHEQARRFFSLLFSLRQVENLTIVLPMDRVELAKILGGDAHLLDRLIEVDIPLPAIEVSRIHGYVRAELQELLREHGMELSPEAVERLDLAFVRGLHLDLTNLRRAKQWLNAIDVGLQLTGPEIDGIDFALLQAIRVFHPNAYRILEAELFTFLSEGSLMFVTMRDEELADHRRLQCAAYLEIDPGKDSRALKAVSEVLMPDFRLVLRGDKPTESFETLSSGRFAHPQNGPKYFLLRPEENDVPQAAVDQLVRALGVSDRDAEEAFAHFWQEYGVLGPSVFDRLLQRAENLDPASAERLVTGIGRHAEHYARESRAFKSSQADRARAAIYAAANRVDDVQRRFEGLIGSTPSIDFAVEVLFFLTNRDRNHIFRRWDGLDTGRLRSVLLDRVQNGPVEQVVQADFPGRILAAIGKEGATEFVVRAFGEGMDVETILTWFRQYASDESGLSFNWIQESIDPAVLVGPAETSSGRRSSEFMQWWRNHSSGGESSAEPSVRPRRRPKATSAD